MTRTGWTPYTIGLAREYADRRSSAEVAERTLLEIAEERTPEVEVRLVRTEALRAFQMYGASRRVLRKLDGFAVEDRMARLADQELERRSASPLWKGDQG